MCACEWNYTCPKCKGVTEHDDVYADFTPEPLSPSDYDLGSLIREWEDSEQ